MRIYTVELVDGSHVRVNGTLIERQAWTGGHERIGWPSSDPRHAAWLDLAADLLQEQIDTFVSYWGDQPDTDTRGIFWGRAKADSFRTLERAFASGQLR